MKIKEVQAGVKISKNYNSYQVNLVADLEKGEIPERVGEELIERASKILNEKVSGLKNSKENVSEIEVGAAWMHKKSSNLLSVKLNGESSWEIIKISDLKKIGLDYLRRTNEGIFVFRKIPVEKRTSNKMPLFRIYKKLEVKNEK